MKGSLVVFGSLNYDFVMGVARLPGRGATVSAYTFQQGCGGKGANQALQAAKLGMPTAMIGCVGRDFMGDAQISCLSASGVDTSYIHRHDSLPTGSALITVEDSGENTITIFAGANSAAGKELIDGAQDALASCTCLLVQLETPVESTLYAMKKAKALGKFVILDPAPAVNVPEEIWALPDLIKPNETEAAYFSGLPVDRGNIQGWAEHAARILRDKGPRNVVITLGDQGAYYLGDQGEHFAPCYPVDAVDATAAGDAYVAALAASIAQGKTIAESMGFACAVSALVVSRPGAQSSLCTRLEVEQFLSYGTSVQSAYTEEEQ